MTGCPAAIEAARRYRERVDECRLAYNLHLRPGFRCRRLYPNGQGQCGMCAKDLRPEEKARLTGGEIGGTDAI